MVHRDTIDMNDLDGPLQDCTSDEEAIKLVNMWLRDKDIRVFLKSVVEKSSFVAYLKTSPFLVDILFHIARCDEGARSELFSAGFRFLARIGSTGMEGICVRDGRRVVDFMGAHDCLVCLDRARCSDHIFCPNDCTFWCCRSCFVRLKDRPRACCVCKAPFPAHLSSLVPEDVAVEDATALVPEAGRLDADQMEKYARRLEFAEETGLTSEVVDAYGSFGDAFRRARQYEQAAGMYEKQALAAAHINDVGTQARSKISLAAVYQSLGQNRKAVACAEEGMRLASVAGLTEEVMHGALETLGTAHMMLKQLDRAVEMFRRQLVAARGDDAGECSAKQNLATLFLSAGKHSVAVELFEECLHAAGKCGDDSLSTYEMSACDGLGDAYLSLQVRNE